MVSSSGCGATTTRRSFVPISTVPGVAASAGAAARAVEQSMRAPSSAAHGRTGLGRTRPSGNHEGVRRGLAVVLVGVALARATRAAALTVADGFDASVLADGLSQPTAAAFAPDGRLFILEKEGTVRVWKADGGVLAAPALTLPSCTDSEMGLLGLAFDPGFASNGFLYLYHTHPPGGDVGAC